VWHLSLWGLSREWEVEIIEQRPNERIAWKSLGGTGTTGVVTFHRLSDRLTRIEVNVNLKPHGVLETTVAGFRVLRRAFRSGLNRFKAFVELREEETGAWLGRIDEGEVVEGNGARKSRARTRDSRESRDKKQVKKRAPRKRARREPDDEDESAYDEEEPEEYEEEEPEASEDDEEPDEEPEDEPTPRKRPVRRRPPARSGRQSRGRRQ
jgi:hypothetical protein